MGADNWANARIIALFILSGLFFVAFVASQLWQKDRATVPPGVFSQRTVWACSLYVFFLFGSFIALLYYLPLWLQAIQEASAVQSGIDILPTILSTVISALVGGALISWIGYYTWACIVSSMVATVVSQSPRNHSDDMLTCNREWDL